MDPTRDQYAELKVALDRFDQDGKATIVLPSHCERPTRLFGRVTWGGRPKSLSADALMTIHNKTKVSDAIFVPAKVLTPYGRNVTGLSGAKDEFAYEHRKYVVLSAEIIGELFEGGSGVRVLDRKSLVDRIQELHTLIGEKSKLDFVMRMTAFMRGISTTTGGLVFPDASRATFAPVDQGVLVMPDGRVIVHCLAISGRHSDDVINIACGDTDRSMQVLHDNFKFVGIIGRDAIKTPTFNRMYSHEINARWADSHVLLAEVTDLPLVLLNAVVGSHDQIWPGGFGLPNFHANALSRDIKKLMRPSFKPRPVFSTYHAHAGKYLYHFDGQNWLDVEAGSEPDAIITVANRTLDGRTPILIEEARNVLNDKNRFPSFTESLGNLLGQFGQDLGLIDLWHSITPEANPWDRAEQALVQATRKPMPISSPVGSRTPSTNEDRFLDTCILSLRRDTDFRQ